MVLSAVGSVIAKVVSKASSVAPSNTNGLAPWIVPFTVTVSVTASPKLVLAEKLLFASRSATLALNLASAKVPEEILDAFKEVNAEPSPEKLAAVRAPL